MSSERQSIETQEIQDHDTLKAKAIVSLRADVNASLVISEYAKSFWGKLHDDSLADVAEKSIKQVQAGDLKKCEAMLMSQAMSLQSIFVYLARRANSQEYIKNMETILRLALKAQSQCRTTLETLANIKNPPMVYAKQANIAAGGYQQVNNSVVPPSSGIAVATEISEKTFSSNELLEQQHEQRLDTRTTEATINVDPGLAAMG